MRQPGNGFLFVTNLSGESVPSRRLKLLVWVTPVLFLVAGLLWLGASFWWVINAEETVGTVTRVYEWTAENAVESGDTLYGPVYSYIWSDGTETSGALAMSSPDYNFEIGTQHAILFDPDVKGNVRFPGFAFNYLGATVILAIGAMFALISLVLWVAVKNIARKRDQKEAST